jgi:hypothetical protein
MTQFDNSVRGTHAMPMRGTHDKVFRGTHNGTACRPPVGRVFFGGHKPEFECQVVDDEIDCPANNRFKGGKDVSDS